MISILCRSALVLIFLTAPVHAAGEVATLLEQVRTDESKPRDFNATDAASPEQVLAEVRQYQNDPKESVRLVALSLVNNVARRSTSKTVRQQCASYLFDVATSDVDAGVARMAAENLVQFHTDTDFTPAMRQGIHQMLQMHMVRNNDTGYVDRTLIKLAGVAHVRSLIPRLQELATAGGTSGHAANMALARMGDKAATRAVIDHVQSNPNAVFRVTRDLHDLAYIRQPEGVEVLVKYLFSEEAVPGNNTDVTSTPYSHYALDVLKRVVEGMPEFYVRGDSGQDLVNKARAWVQKQGGAAKLKIKR
jgi:hypothetical protein